jgi:hypothetical protein
MQPTSLKYFVWNLRRSLEQLGLPGVAGLGLLAFCGMFYFSTLLPEQNVVNSLQRELDVAQASPASNQKVQQPADQLKMFYEFFPLAATAPDTLLAKLHEEASANGVTLDQGEYRVERNEGDRLVRYGVVLPIRGEYLSIRQFLSQSLVEVPYASLDKVEFQRQKITDATLDAQVRMTFFLVDN